MGWCDNPATRTRPCDGWRISRQLQRSQCSSQTRSPAGCTTCSRTTHRHYRPADRSRQNADQQTRCRAGALEMLECPASAYMTHYHDTCNALIPQHIYIAPSQCCNTMTFKSNVNWATTPIQLSTQFTGLSLQTNAVHPYGMSTNTRLQCLPCMIQYYQSKTDQCKAHIDLHIPVIIKAETNPELKKTSK